MCRSRILRQTDQRIRSAETEPAQVARQTAHDLGMAALRIDHAATRRAGIEQPQPPVVPAGRMRHRQPAQDDLVGLHVDQHAAGGLLLAPRPRRVRGPQRGDVARPPVTHRDAVQMAAILGHQIGDERRLPDRQEIEIVAQPWPGRRNAWPPATISRRAAPRRACSNRPCDRSPGANKGRRIGRAVLEKIVRQKRANWPRSTTSCRVASSQPIRPETARPSGLSNSRISKSLDGRPSRSSPPCRPGTSRPPRPARQPQPSSLGRLVMPNRQRRRVQW